MSEIAKAPRTPEGLDGSLTRLEVLFESLLPSARLPRSPWTSVSFEQSSYRVLTIAGTRGAGKTTLLRLLAARLDDRPDVAVIPALEPEMFGLADNVFGAVAVRLQRLLERVEPEALSKPTAELSAPAGARNVAQAIDRLLRQTALIHDSSSASAVAPSSLEQYSSDFARHALVGESFTESWDATVEACCAALARGGEPPVLVIPVDDPDLAPHLLGSILQDIRMLARTPRVVVCVCLDIAEARRVLGAGYASSLGLGGDPGSAYSVVESQLSKGLPQRLRVSLGDLTQDERLHFTPFGLDGPPLVDLLSSFPVHSPYGSFPMGDLFRLRDDSDGKRPSPYTDCLPAVPRSLENLYYSLASFREDSDTESAVRVLLESAIGHGFQQTPTSAISPEGVLRIERPQSEDDKPRLFFDFSGIAFVGRSTAEILSVSLEVDGQEIGIEIGSMGVLTAKLESRDSDLPDYRLHSSLMLGMLLGREFSQHGDVFDDDFAGGEPISGGRPDLLNIRVGSMTGDEFFLILPQWKTFYDYFAFERAWRTSLIRARDITSGPGGPGREIVGALVIDFLRMVAETQMSRAPRPLDTTTIERLVPGSRDAERCLDELTKSTIASLQEAVDSGCGSARDIIFQRWIDRFLPMACHPWLIPEPTIKAILNWRETAKVNDLQLLQLLNQRIRRNLGDAWVTPIVRIFAERPGSELEGLLTSQLHASERREALAATSAFSDPVLVSGDQSELVERAKTILRDLLAEEQRIIDAE